MLRGSYELEEIPEILSPQKQQNKSKISINLSSLDTEQGNLAVENERLRTILMILNQKYLNQK